MNIKCIVHLNHSVQPENKRGEAFRAWRNVYLLFSWNLIAEIEYTPANGHHLSFALVYDTILYVYDRMFPCAEYWRIILKNNVLGVVCFWGRKMDELTLEHQKKVVP